MVEELRKIILTTELIELPKKFEEMLNRMERLEKSSYLKSEFGRFRGNSCK